MEKNQMAIGAGIFLRDISGVIILFMILMFGIKSFAQDNPVGYISIDCGSMGSSVDPQTNLSWVDDENYIVLGKSGQVQNPDLVNSTFDNYHALRSFRYFSEEEMRSKYCYELPLRTSNISFLLRAMFLHGNASELSLPTEFDVYVNGTHWITVKYTEGDELLYPVVQESIFYFPPGGNITNICLVPNQGIPFISSLELRLLDAEGVMYSKSFVDRTHQELFFTNIVRLNVGATRESTVRYPDDLYDRLWTSDSGNVESDEIIKSRRTWSRIGPDTNSVPSKVMEDAWSWSQPGWDYYWDLDLPNTEPGSLTYGIFYFALLNESTRDQPISLKMSMDTEDFPSFNITSQPSQKSFFHVLNANFTQMEFYNRSVLNALEIYRQDSFIAPTTFEDQVYVVNRIKEDLNMTDWQGDPCTPVPYNWIGCELWSSWWVVTLTLSHLQNVSRLIEYVNVSDWSIFHLSITNSNIDSNIFQSLLKNFVAATYLNSLNMSFNNISTFPDAEWWINVANGSMYGYFMYSLDFSYNQLSQLPQFVDIPFSYQLQTLNISNNKLEGMFPSVTSFSNLSSLQVLNLSNNKVYGQIPFSLSSQNLPSLQVLDISNNDFSEEFPSDFYFVDGPLQLLNADNNKISGVLNLTTWYQNLKNISETPDIHSTLDSTDSSSTVSSQLFSFLNNKISSIEPSAEDFEPLIEVLMNREPLNQGGVLLGGNPYCKNAKFFAQKYLCRWSLTDVVHPDVKKKSKKAIIVGSALGGGFLLLCLAFFIFVIWRLARKVHVYKLVQQELANRNVQPPYFSYSDLRLATRNFHKDNHLGQGNFGAVYKGILPDGTTIAVKRLFNSTKKQVLTEFLNEVVLISGIKHKNLIQLRGCCIENQERILVFEFAEKGNVEDALWGDNSEEILSWRNRLKICVGVASGLTYLHEGLQPRIIHRDIKPGNILLDKNFNPKIADFGLAKHFLEEVDMHVTQVISGTRGYFAPEYIMDGKLTTKVDVYSFGILALEIVSGRKCFDPRLPPEEIQLRSWAINLQRSGSTLKLLDPVIQMDYSAPEVLKVVNIALMCVQADAQLRPTMSAVEIMLREGQDRMYQTLRKTAFGKEENSSSLNKIFRDFGAGMGDDTISTLFSGRSSEGSGVGSSHAKVESRPLLYSPSTDLESETSEELTTSSSTTKEYSRALRSMHHSLSDRIRRGSSGSM